MVVQSIRHFLLRLALVLAFLAASCTLGFDTDPGPEPDTGRRATQDAGGAGEGTGEPAQGEGQAGESSGEGSTEESSEEPE